MNGTYEILKAEAARLRSVADRIDAFAKELAGEPTSGRHVIPASIMNGGARVGEYAKLTQSDAILKALERGPMTTRELFNILNEGGQTFKKPVYVTAVLGRLKDQVERTEDMKVRLKQAV